MKERKIDMKKKVLANLENVIRLHRYIIKVQNIFWLRLKRRTDVFYLI